MKFIVDTGFAALQNARFAGGVGPCTRLRMGIEGPGGITQFLRARRQDAQQGEERRNRPSHTLSGSIFGN